MSGITPQRLVLGIALFTLATTPALAIQTMTDARAYPVLPPVAVIELYPQTVQIGGTVFLDGESTWDQYYITNYTWNFTVDTQEIRLYGGRVTYVFAEAGQYLVTLNVTDMINLTDEASIIVNVTAELLNNAPVADAGWDLWGDTTQGYWFYGGWSMDDFGIVNYTWDFHDGMIPVVLYDITPYYDFVNGGTFNVTLTVMDGGGLNDTDTCTAHLQYRQDDFESPVAEAGPDQTVWAGQTVTLDGSASTDDVGIETYKWTLTDGAPITLYGIEATHVFLTPGEYLVILEVYDFVYNSAVDTMTVHVLANTNSPPVADAGENASITPGTTLRFNASGSSDDKPGLQYLWTFTYNGTHEIMFGVGPEFTFDIPGTYHVLLTVTDTGGLTDTDAVVVKVKADDPEQTMSMEGVILVTAGVGAAIGIVAGTYLMERRRNLKT